MAVVAINSNGRNDETGGLLIQSNVLKTLND